MDKKKRILSIIWYMNKKIPETWDLPKKKITMWFENWLDLKIESLLNLNMDMKAYSRACNNPVGVGSPVDTSNTKIMSFECVLQLPLSWTGATVVDVHFVVIETQSNLCYGTDI